MPAWLRTGSRYAPPPQGGALQTASKSRGERFAGSIPAASSFGSSDI